MSAHIRPTAPLTDATALEIARILEICAAAIRASIKAAQAAPEDAEERS